MKKLIAAASVLAIAACSQPATEEEAVEEVVEEAAPAVGGPGTYEVTYADGSVGMLTTSEDGTFSATIGDQTGSGTVSEADGKVCFDPEGDDPEQPTMCWTSSAPAEDGSWTSTSDDGETVTVRPVEAAAEE